MLPILTITGMLTVKPVAETVPLIWGAMEGEEDCVWWLVRPRSAQGSCWTMKAIFHTAINFSVYTHKVDKWREFSEGLLVSGIILSLRGFKLVTEALPKSLLHKTIIASVCECVRVHACLCVCVYLAFSL